MENVLSYSQKLLADWYHKLEQEWEETRHRLTAAEQQFGESAADEEPVVFGDDYALLAEVNKELLQ